MLLRQCCYSTGYPKSAPSTTSSQQTSLGPRAPRTATEHWDFLYHINHTLEVKRIVGQVTLLVHFHLRFLSYYPLLIQFFIKLPSSQTSTFLAAGFRTLSSLLVVFDSWKSKLQHQKTSKLPPGSLSGLVTITGCLFHNQPSRENLAVHRLIPQNWALNFAYKKRAALWNERLYILRHKSNRPFSDESS